MNNVKQNIIVEVFGFLICFKIITYTLKSYHIRWDKIAIETAYCKSLIFIYKTSDLNEQMLRRRNEWSSMARF